VLWVGTDDGALWVTRDGGKAWVNVSSKVGLSKPLWVATIEASRFVEGRAYVVFDAHRSDDDEPYVYVTEDFGQSWKSLRGNLPAGSTRCLREDVEKADLLYLGTEFSCFVSLNRGASWTRLNNNLPTVAVHEIAVHPTAGEIVAATHGRSLWILDVTALRQMTPDVMKAGAHLYRPNTVVRWQQQPRRGGTMRRFVGENPPAGAQIYYSLGTKAKTVSLRVVNYEGKQVATLSGPAEPGLHRVNWNLMRASARPPRGAGGPPAFGGRGGRGGMFGGAPVPVGNYRVILSVDGKEFTQGVRIEADPNAPKGEVASVEDGIDDDTQGEVD
jgi:hypothetical protein